MLEFLFSSFFFFPTILLISKYVKILLANCANMSNACSSHAMHLSIIDRSCRYFIAKKRIESVSWSNQGQRSHVAKLSARRNGSLLVNFYNVAPNNDAGDYDSPFHYFTSDWKGNFKAHWRVKNKTEVNSYKTFQKLYVRILCLI